MLFRGLLLPLGAVLLSGLVGAPSSSGAQDALFVRTQGEIERLWSGVLGCAESGSSFTIRNRFNGSESTYGGGGGSLPTGVSNDYSECGKRALRNTSSRILVDTIEEAVRSGGVSLFDSNFRLDSSVSWVWGENVTGDLDAVVPLLLIGKEDRGSGHALFLQPGLVFWTGLEDQERFDGNLGFVYRFRVSEGLVAGGSLFYDYDFKNDNRRVGAGLDLHGQTLRAGLNYYHPLNEWQEGRADYEEQPLQGGDFRLGIILQRAWLDASAGIWRFEGEDEEKEEWRPSFGVDAGIRIFPGVFLKGGYEMHDEDDSFGKRWNTGLAFRFALPSLDGAGSFNNPPVPTPSLFDPVNREKRILYEERLGIPRVNLSATVARVGEPAAGEGETVIFTAELGKALEEDVTLHVMVAETSTATLGVDFTYGYKVYDLNEETGEQSAPAGDATGCPDNQAEACEVPVPAGVTRFDIEAEILMTAEREVPEFVDFLIEIPEEHARLLRGSGVARVTIEGHGNEIGFAADAAATLAEDDEMTGVVVSVGIDKPSPVPITLDVATSGTATVNEDYRIDTTTLRIPANASSASLTLRGINNERGEGSKSIILTISSGNLPEGWEIADGEHTVTLRDDDLSIFFTRATPSRVNEPDSGNETVTVAVGITQPPIADITVRVTAGGTAEQGGGKDYTFTGENVTFSSSDHADKTFTFDVHADNDPELDKTIILTLDDMETGTQAAREDEGFSLGNPHTITLPANDNTVGFASAASTLAEDNEMTGIEVSVSVNMPSPVPVMLNITPSGEAREGRNGDYTISSRNLLIPANASSASVTLLGIDNERAEGSKSIVLTVSGSLPDGWAFGAQTTHTVTLSDDDMSIYFTSVTPDMVDEPDSGSETVTVAVGITQPPTATLAVRVTAGGTAEQGSGKDYSFTAEDITFGPRDHADKTFTFEVHADDDPELDKTIILTLADMGTKVAREDDNFSLAGPHTITLLASDNTVGFATDMSTLTEGNGTTAEVTVNVNLPSPVPITLDVATSGTATEGQNGDYTTPSRLIIGARQSSGAIVLTSRDEGVSETPETIELVISASGELPPGWTFGTTRHEVLLIDPSDTSGKIGIGSPNAATINEVADGTQPAFINVPVTVSNSTVLALALANDLTLAHTLSIPADENEDPGDDVVFTDVTLDAATGEGSARIEVSRDDFPEDEEVVTVTIVEGESGLPPGWAIDTDNNTYTVTIPANDNTITFIEPFLTNIAESNGTTSITTRIDRPLPTGAAASVTITPSGTGLVQDTDYSLTVSGGILSSNTWTLPTGVSESTLTVTALSDIPANRTLTLAFAGGTLPDAWKVAGDTSHDITITDSATPARPIIGFVKAASTVDEPYVRPGDQDYISHIVEVRATQLPNPSVVLTATGSGTATAVTDYSFDDAVEFVPSGSLTFSLVVKLYGDNQRSGADRDEPEEEETLVITLVDNYTDSGGRPIGLKDNGNNFDLSRAVHTVTIRANDNVVGFARGNSNIVEGDASTSVDLNVNINRPFPAGTAASVSVDIENNGTTVDGDYTVTGDNYSGGILTLPTASDTPDNSTTLTVTAVATAIEDGEGITLTLKERGNSFPPGWEMERAKHAVRFIDSAIAQTIGFAQTSSSAFEGDGHRIGLAVTGYAVPDEGFSLQGLGVAGSIEDATYDGSALADGLNVTVLPGVYAGDNPHFVVDITRDGDALAYEAAETITFTLPDSLGGGFSVGTNTSHTLTVESSNNIAFIDTEGVPDDSLGTVAENGTSINVVVSLFHGAPPGGLPLQLWVTDKDQNVIPVDTTSPVSLSSDLDKPTNYVEFVVPAGMTTYDVPVYIRDNSATATNDTVSLALMPGDGFPYGWGSVLATSNTYGLTIIDDEGTAIVSFSPATGTVTETASGTSTVTTNIMIVPTPSEEVTIPVTFSGNATSYEIASDPAGALTRAAGAATGTVTFAANRGSIELTLTALDDNNGVPDTIKVGIDDSDASFPAGYSGAGNTWTVEIADRGPNTIGWLGYGISFPDTGNVFTDTPTQIVPLDELVVNTTESWPTDRNSNIPVLVVLKDPEGNIYGADRANEPGTTPHDTRYQTRNSIDPPVTFYVGITGTAYGNENRRTADNDGDGQADGEDGFFYLFNSDNALDGTHLIVPHTTHADPATGGIEIGGGVNRLYMDDNVPEYAETLILTLEERAGGMLPNSWAFEEGRTVLTFNIAPSDNTVTFSEPSLSDIYENGGIATITATINNPILAGKTASITITPGGTAVRDTDYTLSVSGGSLSGNTWTLPTGQSTATLTVTAIEDEIDESPDETIELAFSAGTFPQLTLPPGWTATEITHTITIDEDDPPNVSLNYSGSTTIPGSGSNRMTIELSEALTQNITVTLTPGGTATYANNGTGIWSLLYDVLPAGTTTPPATFPSVPDGDCSPAEALSTGCRIEIQAGETVVDVNAAVEVLSSEQTVIVTLGIDPMSLGHVALGTPSTVELTAQ